MAERISPHVQRCIFSFVEMYKKLETNMPEIIPLTETNQKRLLKAIGKISKKHDLYTQTCGTDELYEKYNIHASGCVTPEIFEKTNNVEYKDIKVKPMRKGCHCIQSRDIGAYNTCLNACKYCYANKKPEIAEENMKFHDEKSPILIGHINDTDKIFEPQLRKHIKT